MVGSIRVLFAAMVASGCLLQWLHPTVCCNVCIWFLFAAMVASGCFVRNMQELQSSTSQVYACVDWRPLFKGVEANHCVGFGCRQLFKSIDAQQGTARCAVRIMFLEIHNEEVKDLLHPDIPARVCYMHCINLVL